MEKRPKAPCGSWSLKINGEEKKKKKESRCCYVTATDKRGKKGAQRESQEEKGVHGLVICIDAGRRERKKKGKDVRSRHRRLFGEGEGRYPKRIQKKKDRNCDHLDNTEEEENAEDYKYLMRLEGGGSSDRN